jgi:hypothetical protein
MAQQAHLERVIAAVTRHFKTPTIQAAAVVARVKSGATPLQRPEERVVMELRLLLQVLL